MHKTWWQRDITLLNKWSWKLKPWQVFTAYLKLSKPPSKILQKYVYFDPRRKQRKDQIGHVKRILDKVFILIFTREDPDPVWIRIHNTGKQYLDISCNWQIKFCHLQYWWVVSVFLIRIRNPDKKDFLPYLVDRAASCRPTWWWDSSPCSTFPTHHTSLSLVSKKVFFYKKPC